jgi:photosystem II stability/assembly factor-like uncharacterized protein
VVLTTNGSNFFQGRDGDGGDLSVDPVDPTRMWATNGVFQGPKSFKRWRTTNNGATWVEIETGISSNYKWFPQIEHDQVAPVYLISDAGIFVYRSTDGGSNWSPLNSTPFSTTVTNISVPRWSSGNVVWACLDTATSGDRVWLFNGAGWVERSVGLAQGVKIRRVAVHPTNNTTAYALVNGVGDPLRKIYVTFNQGQTWTNITNNIPNVPLCDLVAHPTDDNKLYLGSEMGCFRSTNAGATWHRWNNGMPNANIVTELAWDDDLETTGKFWVVAGSYGRGIWRRDIAGDDPVDVAEMPVNTKDGLELGRIFPNPTKRGATIDFTLPQTGRVTLKVYDVAGREVATLESATLQAGRHSRQLDARTWSSGVYFARLEANGQSLSRRLVVAK